MQSLEAFCRTGNLEAPRTWRHERQRNPWGSEHSWTTFAGNEALSGGERHPPSADITIVGVQSLEISVAVSEETVGDPPKEVKPSHDGRLSGLKDLECVKLGILNPRTGRRHQAPPEPQRTSGSRPENRAGRSSVPRQSCLPILLDKA